MKTANFTPRKTVRVSILPDQTDEVFEYTTKYRNNSPIRDPTGGGPSPSYTFEIPYDGSECDMTFGFKSTGRNVVASDDIGNIIDGYIDGTAIGPRMGETTLIVKGDHIQTA